MFMLLSYLYIAYIHFSKHHWLRTTPFLSHSRGRVHSRARKTLEFSLVDCISVGVDRMQRNFEPTQRQSVVSFVTSANLFP